MAEIKPSWQREESRIFMRDIFFFFITILISIFIVEQFLLDSDADFTVRLLGYLIIFVPLGVLNLIAHYFYRNRRIRRTGNLRTSLRYRLSLAFMIIALAPSIPIFLLSSNAAEQIVVGMFSIDASKALIDAAAVINKHRDQEADSFAKHLSDYKSGQLANFSAKDDSLKMLFAPNGPLMHGRDYGAILFRGILVQASSSVYPIKGVQHPFIAQKSENTIDIGSFGIFDRRTFRNVNGTDYIFYRLPLREKDSFLILGRKTHPGSEAQMKSFEKIRARYSDSHFRDKTIPTSIRLGLALLYAFMIFFSLVMSWIVARRISMPIVLLAQATREVTAGKLDTRLNIRAQGEIGLLIESFNHMTAELSSLRTRLLHTQRMAAWQEVARRLAHEIKNPLTPIQLVAERMIRRLNRPDRGDIEPVIRKGAATIVEQVHVLQHLVQEFADFARMPEARPTLLSLDSVAEESIRLYSESSRATFDLKLHGDLPAVMLDRIVITGMIHNLIKNGIEAFQSSPSGQQEAAKARILIKTGLEKRGMRRFVSLKIGDNGPGIEAELRERVFEPYFSTKGEHGGGLGLALVERAVMDHDARIMVGESEIGGAEFQILFPIPTETAKK